MYYQRKYPTPFGSDIRHQTPPSPHPRSCRLLPRVWRSGDCLSNLGWCLEFRFQFRDINRVHSYRQIATNKPLIKYLIIWISKYFCVCYKLQINKNIPGLNDSLCLLYFCVMKENIFSFILTRFLNLAVS